MNVLGPRIHGILDYATVVFLLLAPSLFGGLTGGLAAFCYVLAIVHLTMTVLTDFPLGMTEVVRFGVHGIVELVVSLALVVLPWILPSLFFGAQWFFTATGVAIFLVWALTDYSTPRATSKTSPNAASNAASATAASEERPHGQKSPEQEKPAQNS